MQFKFIAFKHTKIISIVANIICFLFVSNKLKLQKTKLSNKYVPMY